MRVIEAEEITKNVREMCIEANVHLSEDMEKAVRDSVDTEDSPLGKQILRQLCENLDVAGENDIPICQDTGMAVFFVNIGQDVHIEGMNITDAINEGVRQGYTDGYLRKSVVKDPLIRENTKDNTPAIIHYDIVPGENIEITIAPKGFGSENMSKVYMLKPADGEEGVKAAVIQAVKDAGPNACPPVFVGVGLGGDFVCMRTGALCVSLPSGRISSILFVRRLQSDAKAIRGHHRWRPCRPDCRLGARQGRWLRTVRRDRAGSHPRIRRHLPHRQA